MGNVDYRLELPATERPFSDTGLFRWYAFPCGTALVRHGISWSLLETVSDPDLEGADQYFQGGREHVIDQATRDSLVAAGFGEYVSGV